ncbi:odorant receptor 67c-like [Pogonomyrmex barbatus]|uniref:Odorant receptor 67c-like n=1 Tax=Pogonomyrmex barbatus TaxID=144034 RepID=A0A8N1S534_9HYME|nr:odorant receptor 67c-like [Pogonomyrmex barbatus]
MEMLPCILDLIFPLNETRSREFYAVTEYFVDKRTYYYPILCHWLIGVSFGGFVVIATCTFQIVFLEHICGLLNIASYRIERSIDEYTLCNSAHKKNCVAHRNIIAAVNIHRKAFKCSELMTNTFNPFIFLIILIGVLSASLNLFQLLKAIILRNVKELISSTIFIGMHFILMFLGNYYGQKITDYNNKIFKNAYNVQWYKAPIKIQKLLLIIMQNTTMPYILSIGNLIMASVEGFAKIMLTTYKYVSILLYGNLFYAIKIMKKSIQLDEM